MGQFKDFGERQSGTKISFLAEVYVVNLVKTNYCLHKMSRDSKTTMTSYGQDGLYLLL